MALADTLQPRGAAWGEDDVITFTSTPNPGGRLLRVPAAGGPATPLGEFVQGHVTQRWPQALPGNKAILYTGFTNVDSFEDACLVVQTLGGGAPKQVQCGGYGWRYVPTGHVLYVHGGTLFAAPFDRAALAIGGAGVPVAEGIATAATSAVVQAAVSDGGVLAYVPSLGGNQAVPIEMLDRTGKVTPLAAAPSNWNTISFSPDGRKLAIDILSQNQSDVWVYDIDRDSMARLTFSAGVEMLPIWTPDGRRLTYGSAQGGPPNLFMRAADGGGEEVRLTQSPLLQIPGGWTPDGKTLVFSQQDAKGGFDIWEFTIGAAPRAIVATPANEGLPALSPDGKWLSYVSDESGSMQIYVRPLGGGEGKWLVSSGTAIWSAWSRKAKELIFGAPDGRMMFVKYETAGGTFRATRPELWTPASYVTRSMFPSFALHPDGDRIAASVRPGGASSTPDRVVIVTDFFGEIRRKTGK